jgi:hypothetical protein
MQVALKWTRELSNVVRCHVSLLGACNAGAEGLSRVVISLVRLYVLKSATTMLLAMLSQMELTEFYIVSLA